MCGLLPILNARPVNVMSPTFSTLPTLIIDNPGPKAFLNAYREVSGCLPRATLYRAHRDESFSVIVMMAILKTIHANCPQQIEVPINQHGVPKSLSSPKAVTADFNT